MFTLIADSNIAHLTDYINTENLGLPIELIMMAGRDITAETLAQYQPDALFIRSVTPINAELLADNRSVQFVGSATIGTDHVNQQYLQQRGIAFANAAGSSKHSVAQYVITAILTLRPQYAASSMSHKPVIGIVGLGNIGRTLASYAQDLGWQILGYDPLLPTSAINNTDFDTLLAKSDVISLHVPLTVADTDSAVYSDYSTHHLIDAAALAKIPTDTLLINSARGAVIDEAALLNERLTAHKTVINPPKTGLVHSSRQVVLDVFEHEPVVSAILLDTLAIATPHIAGYTLEGKLRGTQMIVDAFIDFFADSMFVEAMDTKHDNLMSSLLPPNPYNWPKLKAHLSQLPAFYDIMADDGLLTAAIHPQQQVVLGHDFDALRKQYALRREWQYVAGCLNEA